jgi:microcompartment protein CcmK/EutM
MRIAEVIGTVTLSRVHPTLMGQRFVIGVPFSLAALKEDRKADGEDIVILDLLQAGYGSRIGCSEGVEAAMPFHPERKPVDAYCACILDQITIQDRLAGDSNENR